MRIKFEGIKDTETRVYLFAEVPLGVVIPDGKNDIIKRDRSGHLDKIIDAYRPFLPQSGAVLNSNFIIITPLNSYFYGFSYNKDLTGWHQQIEKGAKLLNVRLGKIVDEKDFCYLTGLNTNYLTVSLNDTILNSKMYMGIGKFIKKERELIKNVSLQII